MSDDTVPFHPDKQPDRRGRKEVRCLVEAFCVAKSEGMIPALESAHALAFAIRFAAQRPASECILVNLSGRGDKDGTTCSRTTGPGH